jgi:hypothetical protein
MHKDVAGLDNRRGSYSTNESAPRTPFYGSMGHGDHGTVIATVDRSPIYSTPSPQLPHNVNMPGVGKPLPYKSIPANYNAAIIDCVVPDAIPAVFTPQESMRTTDDETLAAYANLFGRVVTAQRKTRRWLVCIWLSCCGLWRGCQRFASWARCGSWS